LTAQQERVVIQDGIKSLEEELAQLRIRLDELKQAEAQEKRTAQE